ncbi:MFS transporter [Cytobacillus sp. IB215665]|uniref:MFS transporter n=1 Tax=Cytobacillus sp. IB215665 TaxID=3097357 RepID=UPI002A174E84|nr:MFS transporter [Cytobacillus sp. IB215665]MDX8367674.1 MFS transporter [Cytobacillus sp. IB215665]
MKQSNRILIFSGILAAGVANMMMQTVVATILPQVIQELGDGHLYGWVFSGYLLLSTITIPLFAKMADLFGYKRIFLIGISVFLIGTLLCGLAPSLPFLVIARLIQGIGAGALGPVSIAFISLLFPSENRGKALSAYAAIQLLANLIGPIAGRYVSSAFGWSYAFFMVIPFAFVALLILLCSKLDKKEKQATTWKEINYLGALLLGTSIALFIQGWSIFENSGWRISVIAMMVGCLCLILLFIRQDRRHPEAILPQQLIKIKNVFLANISAFILGTINYGAIAIFPLLSVALFEGTENSSRLLLPLMIGLSIGVILSGRMMQKHSYKKLAVRGWLLTSVALFSISILIFAGIGVNFIYFFAFLTGFGIGSVMPTFMLPAQNAVSDNYQATVGGMIQLSRNIGGAAGIPILTSLMAIAESWGAGMQKFGFLFLVLFFFGLMGIVIGKRYEGKNADKFQ